MVSEAPDRQVAEIQQVEQTSSDETNSVEEMEMETDEIKQVEQNREANPAKGNELTTKKGTKPPINFRAILTDKKIPMDRFDKSSPDELCKQLYAGVFLEPNALASSLSIFPDLICIDGTLSYNQYIFHSHSL